VRFHRFVGASAKLCRYLLAYLRVSAGDFIALGARRDDGLKRYLDGFTGLGRMYQVRALPPKYFPNHPSWSLVHLQLSRAKQGCIGYIAAAWIRYWFQNKSGKRNEHRCGSGGDA